MGFSCSFFYAKMQIKEVGSMLRESLLEMIYCNKRIQNVPIQFASECIQAFEEVLRKEKEVSPYESISELFDE